MNRKEMLEVYSKYLENPEILLDYEGTKLNKKAKEEIIKIISDRLQKKQYGKVYLSYIFAMSISSYEIIDEGDFLELLNPIGREQSLKRLLDLVKNIQKFFQKAPNLFAYYSNVINYIESYIKIQPSMLNFKKVVLRDPNFLYSSLTVANTVFISAMGDKQFQDSVDIKWSKISGLSREDLCDGVSYVLNEHFLSGFAIPDFQSLTEEKFDEKFFSYLNQAVKYSQFKSLAPKILRLFYTFREFSGGYEIFPSVDDFGVSNSFAVYKNQKIILSHIHSGAEKNIFPMSNFVDFWKKKVGDKTVIVKGGKSIKRLVVEVNESIMPLLKEIVLNERMYLEEFVELMMACTDHVTKLDDLLAFEIRPGLNLKTFYRMHRVLRFFSFLRYERTISLFHNDFETFLNSSLASSLYDRFFNNFTNLGFSIKEIESYLNVISFDSLNGKNVFRDIQYTPVMKVKDYYIYPNAVFDHSNILRNAFFTSKKRISNDPTLNRMTLLMKEALLKRFTLVADELDYSFNDDESDVDLLAFDDGTLYLFELKNCLFPATSFEHRTLFDVLHKAANQLDLHVNCFQSKCFVEKFSKKHCLTLKFDEIKEIKTGIILSNRFYSGINFKGHCVRHYSEFSNFLRSGVFAVGEKNEGKIPEFSVWKGKDFKKEDIDNYMSNDFDLYRAAWDSMSKVRHELKLNCFSIFETRYVFDESVFIEKVGSIFGVPVK